MTDLMEPAEILSYELAQRKQSGYDCSEVEGSVRRALASGDPREIERAHLALEEATLRSDWRYEEPTDLARIEATFPGRPDVPSLDLTDAGLKDRLRGAWLGRCAGCNLGKPVEGWRREEIRAYLESGNAYPITDYIPLLDAADESMIRWGLPSMRGHVTSMPRDDDIDYTIVGLCILEGHGRDFGPMDVAAEWLDKLPYAQVYTAERVAYRNVLLGLAVPEIATHRNPYREWIGAQIRADMWGYVNPGDPLAAVRMAYRDASLSHTQNGIYGELWAAALISAAFVTGDVREAIDVAMHFVPPRSRFAEAVADTIGDFEQGVDWETARDRIEHRYYGGYSSVHVINNSAVITAALLWGRGDFTKTIGLAVQGGWDTDCTGATAGSIFGAMHGMDALPGHWIDPLNDRIRSAIFGHDNSRPSDLAERTFQQVGG